MIRPLGGTSKLTRLGWSMGRPCMGMLGKARIGIQTLLGNARGV